MAAHCGSAAASARIPSAPILLPSRLRKRVHMCGRRQIVYVSVHTVSYGRRPFPCRIVHALESLKSLALRHGGRQHAHAVGADVVGV